MIRNIEQIFRLFLSDSEEQTAVVSYMYFRSMQRQVSVCVCVNVAIFLIVSERK